ncbi:hypothetical protein OJF2_43980 [Aquisphaera giovannonii]|uniref:Uncharacterized protein n=1 Tax=Aquisphaera giovannonii TaxID=406548 RepID=A0A5B9W749_9BACT|nr:hypothetical protein [Aquisphaera giovannonii]QEH35841.1 hypothetical protein OJF2_43980 [Aquisphaera giovannonii]
MGAYLDEDMVAHEPDFIAYPHLLVCMGVTLLMTDGSLLGAHVVEQQSQDEAFAGMQEFMRTIALAGITPDRLYLTGNVGIHVQSADNAHGKARKLGYAGIVYVFDTSLIKPKDGTFVMLTSKGPGVHPTIQYKRNEKVKIARQEGMAYRMGKFRKHYGLGAGHQMVGTSKLNELTADLHCNKITEVHPPH